MKRPWFCSVSLTLPAPSNPALPPHPGILQRPPIDHLCSFEDTASSSTNATGASGNSGLITRLTKKGFCLAIGTTAVHLLSRIFLGLRGFTGVIAFCQLPVPPPRPTRSPPWRSSCSSLKCVSNSYSVVASQHAIQPPRTVLKLPLKAAKLFHYFCMYMPFSEICFSIAPHSIRPQPLPLTCHGSWAICS